MSVNDNVAPNEQRATTLDEYAYLERNEFTSEKFKLKLLQLPRFYGIGELKKLLNVTLKLGVSKIKAPRKGSRWVYICFRGDDERTKATGVLNSYVWKGKQLRVEEARPAPDPLVKKRKEAGNDDDVAEKKQRLDERSQEERLKDSTIPYWNVPYDEQLRLKQAEVRKLVMRFGNEVWKENPLLRATIESARKTHGGLPCELLEIRRADEVEGYRNKCEFTVGVDAETNLATVGFRLGSYVTGFTGVAPVDALVHIPAAMKTAAKVFESFVRSSEHRPYDPVTQDGHFKQLTVRCATGRADLMLIVGVQTKDLDEAAAQKLKDDLVAFFRDGELAIVSLYFQTVRKRKPGEAPPKPELLHGEPHLSETLNGLTFRIPPESFFQINTRAAELMYRTAIELVAPTSDTTVVDVCCGIGTIGLCFAERCGRVLGLESDADAVEQAKRNADMNGIGNAEFFDGRAEDVLSSVLARAVGDDVVAVVDPPRAGLHRKAIAQLRQCGALERLLFVSCDASAAMKNFVDLCRPTSKTMRNDPFVPVRAVAVDMFPFTKHCELVVLFERFGFEKKSAGPTGADDGASDRTAAERE